MGWRFQKRLKIMPGVTMNLSKSGVSTSIGTRGARITFGHGKRRTTVGLPGTGISFTEVESTSTPQLPAAPLVGPTVSAAFADQAAQVEQESKWPTLLKAVAQLLGAIVVALVGVALAAFAFLVLSTKDSGRRRRY